jgi:putative phosphoribosyl transferase
MLSMESMHDRTEAGRLIADLALREHVHNPVVVGLGAGGLSVAAEVARRLGASLDLMVVRELDLGDPLHPPTYLGAVDDRGSVVVHPEAAHHVAADGPVLEAAVAKARASLAGDPSLRVVRQARPPVPLAGRTVVLVDDGISPKSLLHAAIDLARAGEAQTVVVALPCAPRETVAELERVSDGVLVAQVPAWLDWFRRHGHLYEDDRVLSREELGEALAGA